jgi:hypothetical protein
MRPTRDDSIVRRLREFLGATTALLLLSAACGTADPPRNSIQQQVAAPVASGERWDGDEFPLRYCTIETDDAFLEDHVLVEIAERAFETWGIEAIRTGACRTREPSANGLNEIGWGSLATTETDAFFEAGVAETYRGTGGRIVESDILIEKDPPPVYQSRRCLLGTMIHEVGHLLGLDHLPSPAIMQTETAGCTVALTRSDRAEFVRRYPTVATSQSPSNERGARYETMEEEVAAFVEHQFDLFRREDWATLYTLYSPTYQSMCPFERFLELQSDDTRADFDPTLLAIERVRVRVFDERATVTYRYTYAGEYLSAVTTESPDIYTRISGRWYDDIDEHTDCDS